MSEPSPNFIDLTEVFSLKAKISEVPHTWQRNIMKLLDRDYDYEAKYETTSGTRQVLEPVSNIRRVDEYLGDYFGAKSKIWLKQGMALLVKDDTATILKKINQQSPRV